MSKKQKTKKEPPREMSFLRLLPREIERAREAKRPMGIVLLQAPANVPRSICKELPGRSLGYQEYPKYRRFLNVLENPRDEDLLAARKSMHQACRRRGWGVLAVGLALWPVNGKSAEELLEWARFDAQRQVKNAMAARSNIMTVAQSGVASDAVAGDGFAGTAATANLAGTETPLLGRFLVEGGYITDQQLQRGLEMQRFEHILLGGLALRNGMLSQHEVLDVLFHQEATGDLFGEAAKSLGFLNDEQIKRLLDQQQNNLPRLGCVLEKLGYVTSEEIARAMDELNTSQEDVR